MKFIRFGDSLLNLEQVVLFVVSGSSVIACFNGDDHTTETTSSNDEAQARFKELSDYLVDEKQHTKSGGEPKPRVMTAGEATKLPDILGKRVKVFDFYTADQIDSRIDNDDPLRVSSGDDDFIWLDKTQMIEVLD